MNEIGRRQVRHALRTAREAADKSRREASRAAYFLRRATRASYCAITGRHDWTDWRRSSTPFVPPERRWCRRCTGVEYRGSWPEIRVEAGSMFRWAEDVAE